MRDQADTLNRADTTVGADASPLVGRSIGYRYLTATEVLVAVGAVIFLAAGSAWGDLIAISAVLGSAVGFTFQAAARAVVLVYSDHVFLRNMWRTVDIDKSAIEGLRTEGGIRVILKSSRVIAVTAYPPTLNKGLGFGAKRDQQFGQAMAEKLGVDPQVDYPSKGALLPAGSVRTKFRVSVPATMMAFSAITMLVAAVAKWS